MKYIYFLNSSFIAINTVKEFEINQEYQDLCDIVRSIFFISNEIRRDNTFLIINNDRKFSIKLNGNTLKNLRPDFYNIFMFLKKIAKILNDKFEISLLDKGFTILPGVDVIKIDFEKFLLDLKPYKKLAFFMQSKNKNLIKSNLNNFVVFLNKIKNLDIYNDLIPADINPFNMDISTKILLFNYYFIDI